MELGEGSEECNSSNSIGSFFPFFGLLNMHEWIAGLASIVWTISGWNEKWEKNFIWVVGIEYYHCTVGYQVNQRLILSLFKKISLQITTSFK